MSVSSSASSGSSQSSVDANAYALPYVPSGPQVLQTAVPVALRLNLPLPTEREERAMKMARELNAEMAVSILLQPSSANVKHLSEALSTGIINVLLQILYVPEIYACMTFERFFNVFVPCSSLTMQQNTLVADDVFSRNFERSIRAVRHLTTSVELFLFLFMTRRVTLAVIIEYWSKLSSHLQTVAMDFIMPAFKTNPKSNAALLSAHISEQLVSAGTLSQHSWLRSTASSRAITLITDTSPISSRRLKEWILDDYQAAPMASAAVTVNMDAHIARTDGAFAKAALRLGPDMGLSVPAVAPAAAWFGDPAAEMPNFGVPNRADSPRGDGPNPFAAFEALNDAERKTEDGSDAHMPQRDDEAAPEQQEPPVDVVPERPEPAREVVPVRVGRRFNNRRARARELVLEDAD